MWDDFNEKELKDALDKMFDKIDSPVKSTEVLNKLMTNPDIMGPVHENITTIGTDFYFLIGILTMDMIFEADRIQMDFFRNRGGEVEKLNSVCSYIRDGIRDALPGRLLLQRTIRLALNGAKIGDGFCKDFLLNLYKTYHKAEYNQLKRFRRITTKDILYLTDSSSVSEQDMIAVGRILTIGKIMGIEVDPDCRPIYAFLERFYRKKEEEEEQKDLFFRIPQDVQDESEKVARNWLYNPATKEMDEKKCKIIHRNVKFVEKCLQEGGYRKSHLYNYSSFENTPDLLTRTLAMLKCTYPKKEFTFEEVQMYAVQYLLAAALTGVSDDYDLDIALLTGDMESVVDPERNCLYQDTVERNIQAPIRREETSDEVRNTDDIPEKEKTLTEEIEKLRRQLAEQEQQTQKLQELYQKEKEGRKEYDTLLQKYEENRKELISLREYAFKGQDQEAQDDVSESTYESMKQVVAEKKIMLIGGHTNWINKLRREFPNWIYVPAEITQIAEGKQFDGIDKLYFFTDHLSHGTYGKYISLCRELDLSFGYLRSINLKSVVKQIYEDFVATKE